MDVDPAVLAAAAGRTRALADDANSRLKTTEADASGSVRGWSVTSKPQFDAFVEQMSTARTAVVQNLDDLEQGLRFSADGYAHADATTASAVSSHRTPLLNLD
ncbi:hypothetical protein CH293_06880 [Rhodococcus sp. 14-2470-1b]|uniref:WXG100 family type VII secretion target n=1 Tax=Rhodococcus sp. 14-2470-1b TaxID=2023149 RepID=UPI000B9BA5BF|nr:WXG100 family type VII secretion target [Rhodococcus sp. 14-2470-1b]OZF55227.1 hypothetical protein CH293_06880 [Rhodococcus sp. 14-2470-1b]